MTSAVAAALRPTPVPAPSVLRSDQDAMFVVGGVDIAAGLVVAIMPRFGGLLVAGWLAGIIVSLLLVGGYADIALRDFGLLLGALTLARLASAFPGRAPDHGRAH